MGTKQWVDHDLRYYSDIGTAERVLTTESIECGEYFEHVYSPYRQKHTKYTKDSTQIHKNQVHKKDKTEKQSIIQ